VYVGTADGGFMNFDQNFASLGLGHGNLPQLQTGACLCFNDGVHILFHDGPPFMYNIGCRIITFHYFTLYAMFLQGEMMKK
jgi:hypothetical protein